MASDEDKVQSLMDMGFDKSKAEAALEAAEGSVEQALNSLVQTDEEKEAATASGPKSYRCQDTGQTFRTMRDAQLYAERTGNQNFEEIDLLPPMTEEEKKEQMAKLKQLIEKKKMARQKKEAEEQRQWEIQRRIDGQQTAEIREKREKEQRMRGYEQKKEQIKRDKARNLEIKDMLAKDKAERAADAARAKGEDPKAAYDAAYEKHRPKAAEDLSPEDILDKAIQGMEAVFEMTGKKAMTILGKILGNIIDNPNEEKFRKLKTSGKTFKTTIGKSIAGKKFLKTCGFSVVTEDDGETYYKLDSSDVNIELLTAGQSKLKAALGSYA